MTNKVYFLARQRHRLKTMITVTRADLERLSSALRNPGVWPELARKSTASSGLDLEQNSRFS